MQNVCNLKTHTIYQHDIAANHDVGIVRRRWRKHRFQLTGTGLNLFLKAGRQSPIDNQLSLEPRRKAVALGQTGRQVRRVRPIPIAGRVAVMIGIPVVVFFVAFAVAMVIIVIVAIVFLVAAAVPLGNRRCCRKGKGEDGSGTNGEPFSM